MIESEKLEKLVAAQLLTSYAFDVRDDTGSDPYYRLEMIFPNGDKIVILPDPDGWNFGCNEPTKRIGIY